MPWITGYRTWLSETESLNNAQMVANHFKGTDWTPEAISALCGNMRHESSINPDMYEYGYTWEEDRGYGLVQWTPRSKYWDWAVANGLDPELGDSQLARIDYEVVAGIQWYSTSSYPLSFAEFRANSGLWTVDYLTEAFTWNYERPNRTAGEESMPDRQAFARRCLVELDFSGNGSGGGGTPSKSTNGGGNLSSSGGGSTQYKYEKEATVNNMTYYQVKAGDSLSEIAKRHGVDIKGIKRVQYTTIANKNMILPNEVLLLPKAVKKVSAAKPQTPATYLIKKGDNLSSIAKRYNTTVATIQKKNGIKDPNKIYAGQRIKL